MKCKHEFKSVDASRVYVNDVKESYFIEKFQCIKCKKWYFKDMKTGKRINFKGALEEEVEDTIE